MNPVRKIAGNATLLAMINLVLTGWHLYLLGKLHPDMTGTQLVLFGGAINLLPLTAAALSWSRFRRLAGWLLAIFFGAVAVIGGYEHFVRPGPDNFLEMAAGAWTASFRVSAVLLVIVDILGCWIGVRMAAANRAS
jgi:hypothetical protein